MRQRLGATRGMVVEPTSLAEAVQRLEKGEALRPRDLRLCAFGATSPVERNGATARIVDSERLVAALQSQLRPLMGSERRGRRLAFALASSIVAPTQMPTDAAMKGMRRLGHQAVEWANALGGPDGADPVAAALRDGTEFFTTLATDRFHGYMLTGDTDCLRPLDTVNAPPESWARRAAVITGLAAALAASDSAVQSNVEPLLVRLDEQASAVDQGFGMVLQRWTRLKDQPESPRLRDRATRQWGSPLALANHQNWDYHAGKEARLMVTRWITRRAIEVFFAMAGGPTADAERIEFWRRYADAITDFRFYLGTGGRRQLGRIRQEIGGLADDRSIVKNLSHSSINAFAMTIGDYMFVEFSEVGNALYIYEPRQLPPGFNHASPTPKDLKSRWHAIKWVSHMSRWQGTVQGIISDLTGHRPGRG